MRRPTFGVPSSKKAQREIPAPALPLSIARDVFPWPTPWMCVGIFVVTLLAYLPVFSADFIWDDPGHITRPALQSLGGLVKIWFEPRETQQYYPLLHSAFWFEHRLWGDSPAGYHAINVLFHATSACLLGVLLRRLAIPGAWFAALLFALHPVCVESVAWITEQKNTLSTVFYLCAALVYLRFDEDRRPARYALASVLFFCALTSKTVTATLPAALLVVLWWKRGKLIPSDVLPLMPWFLLGGVAGWFTSWVEKNLISAGAAPDETLSLVEHGLLAGRVILFYLGKLLWPADLIFFYTRWEINAHAVWQFVFPIGVLGIAITCFLWRKKSRGPLAVFLLFAGTLFPALGFVNVFPFVYSWVADHFQYLASISVFVGVAAAVTAFSARLPRWGGGAIASVVLIILGILTSRQSATYRDIDTFYQTILARNPECWMAYNNLSMILVDEGRVQEAIPLLERALQIRPDYPEAENNLGDNLNRLGRAREAMPHLERALRLRPRYPEALNNLGAALMSLNRVPEAVERFKQSIAVRPTYATAHWNLGRAVATSGNVADAIPHFTEAVRLEPESPDHEFDLGRALTVTGRFEAAVSHFERALELRPEFPEAHSFYGSALASAGRLDDAIYHLQEALLFNPNDAEARRVLAATLRRTGRAP